MCVTRRYPAAGAAGVAREPGGVPERVRRAAEPLVRAAERREQARHTRRRRHTRAHGTPLPGY